MQSGFQSFLANDLLFKNDGQGLHVTDGDDGGATAYGATLPTLGEFLGRTATIADLQALQPGSAELAEFYHQMVWVPVRGDDLPAGVDLMVADFAVVDGPGTSIEILQRAVQVKMDGDFGPGTLAAVNAMPAYHLIARLTACQAAHDGTLKSFARFGGGWETRVADNAELAVQQQMALSQNQGAAA